MISLLIFKIIQIIIYDEMKCKTMLHLHGQYINIKF